MIEFPPLLWRGLLSERPCRPAKESRLTQPARSFLFFSFRFSPLLHHLITTTTTTTTTSKSRLPTSFLPSSSKQVIRLHSFAESPCCRSFRTSRNDPLKSRQSFVSIHPFSTWKRDYPICTIDFDTTTVSLAEPDTTDLQSPHSFHIHRHGQPSPIDLAGFNGQGFVIHRLKWLLHLIDAKPHHRSARPGLHRPCFSWPSLPHPPQTPSTPKTRSHPANSPQPKLESPPLDYNR